MLETVQSTTEKRLRQINGRRLRVLAVGAHSDDIEIGAGGLIYRLQELGHEVSIMVLTDDKCEHLARARSTEARNAARILKVPDDHVYFAHLVDGHLRADGESVATVRAVVERNSFDPDLIIGHSEADSHNDHVEASRLIHAAFRKRVILKFPIHISAESERFSPTLFIHLADTLRHAKNAALRAHRSQLSRIIKSDLDSFCTELGRVAGVSFAEAFEVVIQDGAPAMSSLIASLNSSLFHRFWSSVTQGSETPGVSLLYSGSIFSDSLHQTPADAENRGRDALRVSFSRAIAKPFFLRETSSESVQADDVVSETTTPLLVGGAISNHLVRDLYGKLPSVRWHIGYDKPRRGRAFIRDTWTGERIEQGPEEALLYVSLQPNPNSAGRMLSIAGTDATGTEVGLRLLADADECSPLWELTKTSGGCELLLRCSRDRVRSPRDAIQVISIVRERVTCEAGTC